MLAKNLMRMTVLLLVLCTSVVFADVERVVEKSFDVGRDGTLFVESDFGTITVDTQGRNNVDVKVYQIFDTNSDRRADEILEDLELTIKKQGKDVYVEADYERMGDSFFNWGNKKLKLKFEITVPKEYNVELKTAGGSISVDDLEGYVKAKTSGGSLNFGNIVGPVDGKTSGGSIKLHSSEGSADLHTSGGSIKIGDVNGDVIAKTSGGSINVEQAKGTVVAKTSGGSISVKEVFGNVDAKTSGGSVTATLTKQPTENCSLQTSGGSVNLNLVDDVKVTVDARTSGGRVRSDFKMMVEGEISKHELHGEINGGGPTMYLRTSGGNVNINRH